MGVFGGFGVVIIGLRRVSDGVGVTDRASLGSTVLEIRFYRESNNKY